MLQSSESITLSQHAGSKRVFGIGTVSIRFKLLWAIFAMTQVIGAWGAFYYSPHGSRVLFALFYFLFPGNVLALLLLRDSLTYASFLACAIPLNFVVWFGCAWLFQRSRNRVTVQVVPTPYYVFNFVQTDHESEL